MKRNTASLLGQEGSRQSVRLERGLGGVVFAMKLRGRIGWICLAVVSVAILVFGVVASQSGKLLASARSSRFLLSYA